jgi:hypothetical protein
MHEWNPASEGGREASAYGRMRMVIVQCKASNFRKRCARHSVSQQAQGGIMGNVNPDDSGHASDWTKAWVFIQLLDRV